jgi:predicted dehydrogenase
MRFVVLGAGSIGRRHLANAVSLGHTIAAVHDPDPDRLTEAGRLAGGTAVLTTSERDALAMDADAVLVCSPPTHHVLQARAAVARGRHVLIEKPLSHTLDDVDALVTEAAAARRTVLVGCNLRFLPSMQLVRRLLAEGRIGTPLSARAHFGYYLPSWRPRVDYRRGYAARPGDGGGIILDAIHELDYLRWLLGEPCEVFCYASKLSVLDIDTEDSADILLRFEGGAIGNVHLDYLRRAYGRSCDLIGEDGVIVWDYVSQRVRVYGKEDRRAEDYEEAISAERNLMYVEEIRHFVDCIERGAIPELDAAGGRAVLAIALAAKRSAAEGRPVSLAP